MWRVWVWPNLSNKYAVAATGFLLFQMSSSQPPESFCLQSFQKGREALSLRIGEKYDATASGTLFSILLLCLLKVYILVTIRLGCLVFFVLGILGWKSLFFVAPCVSSAKLPSLAWQICLSTSWPVHLISPRPSLGLCYAGSLFCFSLLCYSGRHHYLHVWYLCVWYLCVWSLCPFFHVLSALFSLHLLISLAQNVPKPMSPIFFLFSHITSLQL